MENKELGKDAWQKNFGYASQHYEISISKNINIVGHIVKKEKEVVFLYFDDYKDKMVSISDYNLFKMGVLVFASVGAQEDNRRISDFVLSLFCQKYNVEYMSNLYAYKNEILDYTMRLELTDQEKEIWQYIQIYIYKTQKR